MSEANFLKLKNIKLFSNSVWVFNRCDKRFGFKYPGRLPGQIYANFFYFFSRERDLILDLFGGSGTSLDVGQLMNRKVIALDLNPSRKDIIKFDIMKDQNFFPENYFQLIFCDPPYYNMNYRLYSDKKTDLANLSLDEYLRSLVLINKKFYNSLKRDGFLGIIISNKREKGKLIDLEFEVNKIFSKKLTLVHKIIVPYFNTSYQKLHSQKNLIFKKFLLISHRTLFIFKKV
ncbi:MAG: DNA methyltransferase [Promethearchaeota archaeon]